MGVVYLNDSTLSDIADAIRYKEGSSNIYYPNQMGMAIRNLNGGGNNTVVDQSIIFDLKILGFNNGRYYFDPNAYTYNYVVVGNFSIVNELPAGASIIKACDIGDPNKSIPAYLYNIEPFLGARLINMGIYSPINNIENVSVMDLSATFQALASTESYFVGNYIPSGPETYNMAYAYNGQRNMRMAPRCGDSVLSLREAFHECWNLYGSPACGSHTIDMYSAYYGCQNLNGSPVCGTNVKNFSYAYYGCSNLVGSPVCGNNVVDFNNTYNGCTKLTGAPVCGDNVVYMDNAYSQCNNLTGSPVCGDNVVNFSGAYFNCTNITGSPVVGNNVVDMRSAYYNCKNLTGNAVFPVNLNTSSLVITTGGILGSIYTNCNNLTGIEIPDSWTNMTNFARNCHWYNGPAVCGPNVTVMTNAFYNCSNLTGNAIFGESIGLPRLSSYYQCNKLTGIEIRNNNANMFGFSSGQSWYRGTIYCPPNTTNMQSAFAGMSLISQSPICGANVTDMSNAYYYCSRMTGSPVCGDKVINMTNTYNSCLNLVGNPVMGNNVLYMDNTYRFCNNLTGQPVLPKGATARTEYTYYSCNNITGYPVLGGTSMAGCYFNCYKLDMGLYPEDEWQSDWIVNMATTFYNCPNIYGNIALLSTASTARTAVSMHQCFYGRDNSRMLNIRVRAGYAWNNWIYNQGTLTGTTKLSWTMDAANGRYYNAVSNIYVYYA